MIDIRLGHECGLRMRKNAKEHNPPKGSMYMFIEFGRLGCKHVIYLGNVYVHDFINVWHVHTGVGNA